MIVKLRLKTHKLGGFSSILLYAYKAKWLTQSQFQNHQMLMTLMFYVRIRVLYKIKFSGSERRRMCKKVNSWIIELRGYMMKYGGRFENYFSRRSVTHIICSNLPYSKVKNLRAFSRGLPVVKPTWIVDCISANRLLGWVPYQLLNDTQPKLSAFFAPRRHSNPQVALPVTSCQPETGYSEAEEGSSTRAEDSEESRDRVGDEIDGVYIEKTTPEMTEQVRTDDLKSSEVNAEILGNYKEEKEVSSELQSTTNLPSVSDNKSSHGKSIATTAGSSVRRHSTL